MGFHCGGECDLAGSGMMFLVVRVFKVGMSFTVPLGLKGVYGWVDSSDVWNVIFFIFLLRVIALRRVDGALFGTLNSKIPNLSEDTYESRICRLVKSQKTESG